MVELNVGDEYEKVRNACDKYGFECILRFDKIYIKTAYDSWYFIPKSNGVVTLMHGNGIGRYPDGYHIQFSKQMKYEYLAIYIMEHCLGKFRGYRMDYTFDRNGKRIKPKQAIRHFL